MGPDAGKESIMPPDLDPDYDWETEAVAYAFSDLDREDGAAWLRYRFTACEAFAYRAEGVFSPIEAHAKREHRRSRGEAA